MKARIYHLFSSDGLDHLFRWFPCFFIIFSFAVELRV